MTTATDKLLFRDLVRTTTQDAHNGRWGSYNEIVMEHWDNMRVGDNFGYPVSGDDLLLLRTEKKGLYR